MDREAMIAALIFGGSGSGGGLPAVTSADNGKILGVKNGAWASDKAALIVPIMTMNDVGGAVSCTMGDRLSGIYEAYHAGKAVLFTRPVANGENYVGVLQNIVLNNSTYTASAVLIGGENAYKKKVVVFAEGPATTTAWIGGSTTFLTTADGSLLPAVTGSDNGKVLGVANGAWGAVADKGEPFYVTFTITGLPSDNVYPCSVDKTIADIVAAKAAGKNVIGTANLGGIIGTAPLNAMIDDGQGGIDEVNFIVLGVMNGAPTMMTLNIIAAHGTETAQLVMTPLSVARMTYDSDTQTLAIYDPLA